MCEQCAKNTASLVEMASKWHDDLQELKRTLWKDSFPIVNIIVSKYSGTTISLSSAGGGHRQSFTLASLYYISMLVSSPATFSIDTMHGPWVGNVNPGSPPLLNLGVDKAGLLFRDTDDVTLTQGSSGAISLIMFGMEMPNHDRLW